jgi:hypothetical protein
VKIIVIGRVGGQERYREEADLGPAGPLRSGTREGPIAEALQRMRVRYDADFPFDPFSAETSFEGGWPSMEISLRSEFEEAAGVQGS